MRYFVIVILQIFQLVSRLKNCENQPIFDKVMKKTRWSNFLTHSVFGFSKYSKILNSLIGFVSNRIVMNYLIRSKISNIRTSLIQLNSDLSRPDIFRTKQDCCSLYGSITVLMTSNNTLSVNPHFGPLIKPREETIILRLLH